MRLFSAYAQSDAEPRLEFRFALGAMSLAIADKNSATAPIALFVPDECAERLERACAAFNAIMNEQRAEPGKLQQAAEVTP